MDVPIRSVWKKAPDFHEIAEALGVETTAIMAALSPVAARWLVLYTPDLAEPEDIFSVWLRTDADGILHRDSVPERQTGLWESIIEQLDDDDA